MLKLDFAAVLTKGGIVLWYLRFFGECVSIDSERQNVLNLFLTKFVAQQKLVDNGILIGDHKIFSKINNTSNLIFIISQPKDSDAHTVHDLVDLFYKNFISIFSFTSDDPQLLFKSYEEFKDTFLKIYRSLIYVKKETKMKTFSESTKSQKTVSSLVMSNKNEKNKKEKEKRAWVGSTSGKSKNVLNFSDKTQEKNPEYENSPPKHLNSSKEEINFSNGDLKGLTTNSNHSDDLSKTSKLTSVFNGFSLKKEMTIESLSKPLNNFKKILMSKNVASEVAEQITMSVRDELVGKKLSTFSNLQSCVKKSLEQACSNILDSGKKINFLTSIKELNGNRPYVITFCGVNGVGKSTNLAKIAFWLIQNNFSILIAACDTFRSGAIEQLKTHLSKLKAFLNDKKLDTLKIDLFARGYGKDPSQIASEAIKYAYSNGFQVVLIDTAGRMQDNSPLMNALGKLVITNKPDCVLFVGEALVGNEAVDQIKKFDLSLSEHSKSGFDCQINGIVLTKFDTIDDKVGAALSMTYITGKPICFVGTGQTYSDIRKLDIQSIVGSLFS